MNIVLNRKLDMSFLKNTLETAEEMSLVNPSAKFPFEEEYWFNFYNLPNRESYSLLLFDDEEVIGHAALQKNLEVKNVHLCFFVISKKHRGKGYAQKFLVKIEQYLKEYFDVNEYYLNVLKVNGIAIKCYEKFGFKDYKIEEDRIKMVKELA